MTYPQPRSNGATLLDLLKGRSLTSKEAAELTGIDFRSCSAILGQLAAHGLATMRAESTGRKGRIPWRYTVTMKGVRTPCIPRTTATSPSVTASGIQPAT